MSLLINTVFDFSCPYCYLAWGYIRKLQQKIPFDVEWMTWEIHPDVPKDGRNICEVVPDVNLEERRYKLNTLGAPVKLAPGNKVFVPNTRWALETVEFSRENHKLQEWVDAVFQGSFAEGKDIGDIFILLDLAENIGLDTDQLRQALEIDHYGEILLKNDQTCAKKQVEWVPTIFVGDNKILEGAFSFEDFEKAIRNSLAIKSIEASHFAR